MSEIRRYEHRPGGMSLSEGWGDYVRWDDHWPEVERLKAENARLTRERDETASRCEKLRELADQSAHESGVAFRRLEQAQERYIRALKGRGGRDE